MLSEIKNVSIVGAGTMGSGIAQLFLQRNVSVNLIDPSQAALETAKTKINDQLELLSRFDLFSQDNINQVMTNLKTSNNIALVSDADLVIEAVPEKLSLKHEVFRKIESHCKNDTLIATNTSGISINNIVSVLHHPERAMGTHFFMPAAIVPLVEVVKGDKTSLDAINSMMNVLIKIGKKPVLINRDIPGFVANRIQHALAREAISLLESGVASAEDIDTVVRYSIGMRLLFTGPLEQRDLNGLDIHYDIARYLYEDLESRNTPSPLLEDKVANGELGLKVGKGFYDWNEKPEKISMKKNAQLLELAKWMKNHL
ncbi:3-hydroxyacyl-CoA dehydrogenase NAD-binding domain-containing protein [Scopulibacillus cellulosilyticus]|uniref:3-hydroxyacyl-CoA dehydrogenase NAD-binding domain-containing protein n=1 Tax=Scopulibacillus cellulosilyticus TaxID=2665665 RepID=A0ABW2Q0A4_9BACL